MSRRKTNRRKVPLRVRVGVWTDKAKNIAFKSTPLLVAIVVLIAVPLGVYAAYLHVISTEYFAVEKISIHGTSRIDPNTLQKDVGLFDGMNIFDVDESRTVEAAKMHPWIADAEIDVRLPSTVTLSVTERQPDLVVQLGPELWYSDKVGRLIEAGADLMSPHTLLTGVQSTERIQERIQDAISIRDIMKEQKIDISEIHHDPVLGFSVVTLQSVEIRIGHDQFVQRIKRANRVLTTRQDDVKYILVDHGLNANRVIVGEEVAKYHGR